MRKLLILALASAAFVFQLHAEQTSDSLLKQLRAFDAKITGQPTEKEIAEHEAQRALHFQLQLKSLIAMIVRAEYDKAHQMVVSGSFNHVPPAVFQDWAELSHSLVTDLEKLKQEQLQTWVARVDQLVEDAREQLLAATSAGDLDPLLMRTATLQMQRLGQDNAVGQRALKKLEGVAATLERWMAFLDYSFASNSKAANESLERLINNQGQFPVLTMPEIRARLIIDSPDDKMTLTGAITYVFDPIQSPADVPEARERLQEVLATGANELQTLRAEREAMEMVQAAWEALQKGDEAAALGHVKRMGTRGSSSATEPYYQRLRDHITELAHTRQMLAATGVERGKNESFSAYFEKLTGEAYAAADFSKVLELMSLHESVDRSEASSNFGDRSTIEKFLAAQRFEAAGDIPMAIGAYRDVVGASRPGPYAPLQLAQDALSRLKEQYPTLFEDLDGVVLQELRAMRHQLLRMQQTQGRGGPGFPR